MKQNIQDLINLISIIKGSEASEHSIVPIDNIELNGTNEEFFAGEKGLFFLRICATDFIGDIPFYINEMPVLQLTSDKSIDTGDIYIICDYYNSLGIADNSGIVTVEGFKFTPNI